MDSRGYKVFHDIAMNNYGRAIARTAHGWTAQQREDMALMPHEARREGLRAQARSVFLDPEMSRDLSTVQRKHIEDNLSALGANVIGAALKLTPKEWVMVCDSCFQCWGIDCIATMNGAKPEDFVPGEHWTCPECEPGHFTEAADA